MKAKLNRSQSLLQISHTFCFTIKNTAKDAGASEITEFDAIRRLRKMRRLRRKMRLLNAWAKKRKPRKAFLFDYESPAKIRFPKRQSIPEPLRLICAARRVLRWSS